MYILLMSIKVWESPKFNSYTRGNIVWIRLGKGVTFTYFVYKIHIFFDFERYTRWHLFIFKVVWKILGR